VSGAPSPGPIPPDPLPSVVLVVLDGWGVAPDGPGNAVSLADTPVFDDLWRLYPHTQLDASGESVGLPPGQMGNSEVGHLNLGAGTVVKQDLARIDEAIESGEFFRNEALRAACAAAREHGGALHLIGLVSAGGVHSSLGHLEACIELAVREQAPAVLLHAFTDGRDTLPTSAPEYVAQAETWLAEASRRGVPARVASVMGRYWGMDRDSRWDRTKRAYDVLVHAEGLAAESAQDAIRQAYGRDETDEFIQPTIVGDPRPLVDGDSVITFNFRPDRMRQIVRALGEPGFNEFDRRRFPVVHLTTMTRYQEDWNYPVAFPEARPEITLAKVLADRGDRQLHVAETEKYAHVTYFFNGGEEHLYPGEERALVPSPRDVATYDEKPEMSAQPAAAAFVDRWRAAAEEDRPFRFGVINFANPDMVGHTGSIPAAIRAVETADRCLGQVLSAVLESGGGAIVTADHGNADEMLTPDGGPQTAHSLNPVPFVVTVRGATLAGPGILADVAPTALALLGIQQPAAMHGRSLLDGT
jgi:2,3-bisphosphoglycerate-independent phosphoglycerate mutase